MARVVFVPRWLNETLAMEKVPLSVLVDKSPSDVIPNRQDLLSYLKAQLDLVKFMTTPPEPLSVENQVASNLKAKSILFMDNWPLELDEVKYHIGMNQRVPEFELLHLDPDAASVNDLTFEFQRHETLPIIFVVGSLSNSASTENEEPVWKKGLFLMRGILKESHLQHRAHIGMCRFSDIVNQNETLTSFYVRDLAFL